MLKISAVYFMWNPETCQDPPTCGQDDLVLLWKKIRRFVDSGIVKTCDELDLWWCYRATMDNPAILGSVFVFKSL